MDTNKSDAGVLATIAILCTSLVAVTAPFNTAMYFAIDYLMGSFLGRSYAEMNVFPHWFRFGLDYCHVGLYAFGAIILIAWSRRSPLRTQVQTIVVFTVVYLGLWLGASRWISVAAFSPTPFFW